MMSAPLPNIPPLIPVPSAQPARTNDSVQPEEDDESIDRFATLFSPPTPPRTPVQTQPEPPVKPRLQSMSMSHRRADSEFGSFVSVPASDDPLHARDEFTPITPVQNIDFFDKFTEEAKAATEENQRELVEELLKHEDDPLYWISSGTTSGKASGSGSGTPSSSAAPQKPISPPPPVTTEGQSEIADLLDLTTEVAKSSFDQITRHLQLNEPASTPLVSSPPQEAPPNPRSQSTEPTHNRRRSRSSTLSSIPTRWISTLLSNPRASAATTTPTPAEPEGVSGYFAHAQRASSEILHQPHPRAHEQSTLPASLPSHVLSFPEVPPSRESKIAANAKVITHSNPFAAHTYVPPSGAPGFGGDREWNKGGFEFEKEAVERKSVRLLGRKEMTSPVLTVEIADQIRPYLPALARLPKSWSLLYSLDQHGISLSTLYTRCQSHPGGALLAIKDSGDAVFGAWVGEGVHPSKGSYYGGGESFLWRMQGGKVKVYRWAGKNDYVALCEPDYLGFGGGDGHYGLYLDDTLLDGSSARCPTFGNEPLCSRGPRKGENVSFECVGLEIWGMGP